MDRGSEFFAMFRFTLDFNFWEETKVKSKTSHWSLLIKVK